MLFNKFMIITGGKFKGRKVLAPDENITRPTLSQVRESLFSTLFSQIDFEGKIFLDLFAGSGIVGLEALSRGFQQVFFVEKNKKAFEILKKNISLISDIQTLFLSDSLKFLQKTNENFDIIYIDPPYLSGIYENVLNIIFEKNLLNKNGIVILEHSQDVNFQKFKLLKQKKYSDKLISFLKIK